MPRMIDLIRASAVPPALMQAAAKGALSLPPKEVLEILVHLASSKPEFSEQAKTTLSGWDRAALKTVISDPKTPKEILDYFVSPGNVFPDFLPMLLEDAAVSDDSLARLAATAARELVDTLLASARICGSRELLTALNSNPNLSGIQAMTVNAKLEGSKLEGSKLETPALETSESQQSAVAASAAASESIAEVPPAELASAATVVMAEASPENSKEQPGSAETEQVSGNETSDGEASESNECSENASSENEPSEEVDAFLKEHAAELATQEEKPFQAVGAREEIVTEKAMAAAASGGTASAGIASDTTSQAQPKPSKKASLSPEEERGSTLQKIAKLDIKGRIQLAMRGNKEERSILIRDGTKLVALAVLESPKITDGEVEKIAAQKNVQESVLRQIPMKRRFAKNYIVVRNLVGNPRTPIDLSLGLMKHLLVNDLKNLSGNKEVSETVRKLALKMFKQKLSK